MGGTEKGMKNVCGCLKARGHLLVLDLDGRMFTRGGGAWFVWFRMWSTAWFCEHGNEPVCFIKDAVSTMDVSFLNVGSE